MQTRDLESYTFQAIAFTVSIVMGLLILRGMEKDAN